MKRGRVSRPTSWENKTEDKMNYEEMKEMEVLQEKAQQVDEILEACLQLRPKQKDDLFYEEMEKMGKILEILAACDWHVQEFPLTADRNLMEWLEMDDEEAEGKTVSYYPTTHGLSIDVDHHEVEDSSWHDIQDIDGLHSLLV